VPPDDDSTTEPDGKGEQRSTRAGKGQSIESYPDEAQDYIRRLREESESRRQEIKDLKAEQSKREKSDQSEGERREAALVEANKRGDDLEARLLRYEAAANKGLPMKLAPRLTGTTKDELEADAEALKKDFGLDGEQGETPAGFDGGVRRSVSKPKSMNGLIREAAGLSS
jgi:hypothetical protein